MKDQILGKLQSLRSECQRNGHIQYSARLADVIAELQNCSVSADDDQIAPPPSEPGSGPGGN